MPRERSDMIGAVLERHDTVLKNLAACQRDLDYERTKGVPFYRSMSLWVPVSVCMFATGWVVGALR